MKVVVYTAIMVKNPEFDKPIDKPGNFDLIPGWDYVLITNLLDGKKIFKKSGWSNGEIRIMEPPETDMPVRHRRGWQIYAARWFKWHPDKIFSEYDYVIWVDGWQIPDIKHMLEWKRLIGNMMNDNTEILHEVHKTNKCIYEEHKSIVFCQKDTDINMLKVSKYVKTMGCPENLGLFWTGCFIYKTGSNSFQKVTSNLWEDMLLYTYRDQALLTFEIWRNNAFDIWGKAPLSTLLLAVDSDGNHGGYL